jgi:YHS domain-containing protein
MGDSTLGDRIKAEFDARAARVRQSEEDRARREQEGEERLRRFETLCEELKAVWRPRLDVFAKQFGDQIKVIPAITPSRREAKVVFLTDLANMTLTLSASASPDLTKLLLNYDLLIVPTFIQYDRHAMLEMPLDKIDREALGKWIDDQLMACVKVYLSMQDNQQYLTWSMVRDPITNAPMLRQDAAAMIEHKGQKVYFSSEDSLRQYKERHQITT